MRRDARPALTRRRWSRRAPWRLRFHGLRGFSRRIESLQHQEQLARIDLLPAPSGAALAGKGSALWLSRSARFAPRSIESFDQRIDLFAQQFVFALQLHELRRRARELFG